MKHPGGILRALLLLAGILIATGAGLISNRSAGASEAVAPVRLAVDLSERKLYVYHGGSVMNTFDVAIGEPEHSTPEGDLTIDRIEWNPDWVPPNEGWAEDKEKKAPNDPENPMREAKLFFEYPDYYIHGTDAPHTIGQAEPHGCIRMRVGDVMHLAEFVQEHGGEGRSDGWFDWVQQNDASEHEFTLPDAIPISIHR